MRELLAPYLLWIKLGALVVVLGVGAWRIHVYGAARYADGQAATQAKWDAAVARGQSELERLRVVAAKVTVKTEAVYVDRVRTIREKGDAIVREVPVFVPAGACELPGGFRLLHDAAALAGPVPAAARLADAAPVDAQDATRTVTANYGTCHETAERLVGLQDWMRAQCAANPPPEGCGP